MMSQKKKTIFYTIFRKPCDKTLAYVLQNFMLGKSNIYEAQFPPHFSLDEKTSNQVFYQYGK